jgi:archaellum component FlaC
VSGNLGGMRADLAHVPDRIDQMAADLNTMPPGLESVSGNLGGMRADLRDLPDRIGAMAADLSEVSRAVHPMDADLSRVEQAVLQSVVPMMDNLQRSLDDLRTDLAGLPFIGKS